MSWTNIVDYQNFIRHGKAAVKNPPPGDTPTTHVSPVHAHHEQPRNYAPAENASNIMSRDAQPKANREDLQRIVAEENESRSQLPKHPGLERWTLVEKMGDGAFSNVYRARDREGKIELDVAIKVVRKYEMNSNQVC